MVAAVYGTGDNNKTHFNRSVQECLVTGRLIPLSPATERRFSDIFAQLKTKLADAKS